MRERERERVSKYKNYLNFIFYSFFLFLNKFKIFNYLNKKLLEVYLINSGYCLHWDYLISKSNNNLFLGENIFIKKFEKLEINNCIDIGANIGDFSLEILNNKSTKVIAFEPLPKCCDKLSLIYKEYGNRFKFFEIALSNKDGFSKLNYGETTSGLSSLETKINKIPYVGSSNTNSIEVITKQLDSFINDLEFQNTDFIKIDVEGHEMAVLDGALKFIKKNHIKLIQIEFNWHNLLTKNTIYDYSAMLEDYVITQLNLINGKLRIINPIDPLSNLYFLSNFIFIEKSFFEKYKKNLIED
jgi:FkbM family methyltransferase